MQLRSKPAYSYACGYDYNHGMALFDHAAITVGGDAEIVGASTFKVREGQGVEMNCSVTDLPAGTAVFSYQWLFTNGVVPAAGNTFQGSQNSPSLFIADVSYLNHLGEYYCIATTSTGQQVRSSVITLAASEIVIKILMM